VFEEPTWFGNNENERFKGRGQRVAVAPRVAGIRRSGWRGFKRRRSGSKGQWRGGQTLDTVTVAPDHVVDNASNRYRDIKALAVLAENDISPARGSRHRPTPDCNCKPEHKDGGEQRTTDSSTPLHTAKQQAEAAQDQVSVALSSLNYVLERAIELLRRQRANDLSEPFLRVYIAFR
jgi:hypothetical protein